MQGFGLTFHFVVSGFWSWRSLQQIVDFMDKQCGSLPELRRVKEEVDILKNGVKGVENVGGNVVIVGAGITGLVSAMLLEDIGVNVTILEVSHHSPWRH